MSEWEILPVQEAAEGEIIPRGPQLLSDIIIDIRQERRLDILRVYFPQKIPRLHRLVVSQRTGKSGQIIYVTEILPSLWFENLSSTYQKGNLHCDPINPLSALLFAFYSSLSSHIVEFLMARFCCCAHDGLGCFSSILLPCLFMFRVFGMSERKKRHIWDEGTLVWHGRAKWRGPICMWCLTGLCGPVQVREEDLWRGVKDERTDS